MSLNEKPTSAQRRKEYQKHLNFEINCLLYSPSAVAELEQAFQRDLDTAVRLDRHVFAHRPFAGRLVDNACRLLSPVL